MTSSLLQFWRNLCPSKQQLFSARHNILLLLFTGLLLLLEPWASALFEFNRQLINEELQLWRLITAHWVHLGLNHWLMNMLGLVLVLLIFQQEQHLRRDCCVFLTLSVLVSLLIWWQSPEIARYVGLSGVIHGYFAYYLAVGAKQTPMLCIAGWLGTLAKVINEQQPNYDSSQTAELINGAVAFDAHLYGFICGSLIGLGYLFYAHKLMSRQQNTNPRE